jgi:hypothetical protein
MPYKCKITRLKENQSVYTKKFPASTYQGVSYPERTRTFLYDENFTEDELIVDEIGEVDVDKKLCFTTYYKEA